MSATPPPGYTPPPTDLPQRGDRTTFSARVDAWVTWFSTVILTQLAAMVANAYANALEAFNSASVATAQAAAAIAAAGATAWVSGTTYAPGDTRYSLINFKTYRRTTAGGGATDPKNDPTNWVLISNAPAPYLHVQDQKTSGTAAQAITIGSWIQRDMNTILGANTITGASLASNQITLPAGDYSFDISVAGSNSNYANTTIRARLYNVTDSVALGYGVTNISQGPTLCTGKFTLTGTKVIQIQQYFNGSGGTNLGGAPSSITGVTEVYLDAQFRQIAA